MTILELPAHISRLLEETDAPIRLRRHLQIVYSTAAELLESLLDEWPGLHVDDKLVLEGAATHDIGKVAHPAELSGPGSQHLEAGHQLLLEQGYSKKLARVALVHERWNDPARTLEELLVSLADLVWNGIRKDELEEFVIQRIAERTESDFWEVYMKMDPVLTNIAGGADERLFFQKG